jgi:uncharacterized Rmd1/YagE family protein
MDKLKVLATKYYIVLPAVAEDILHIQLQTPIEAVMSNSVQRDTEYVPEAFVFSNGSFISWGASEDMNEKLLQVLRMIDINRYSETEVF